MAARAPRPSFSPPSPRRVWLLALVLLALVALRTPASAQDQDQSLVLLPSEAQAHTSLSVLNRLARGHYRASTLDDSLSSQLFDRWLAAVDPGRLFLLADDVAGYERWREGLDDALEDGNLSPLFEIFNRTQQQRMARIDELLAGLDELLAGLSFDGDDVLTVDRSEAPWPQSQAQARALWNERLKNEVLSLRLSDRDGEQIADTLRRRYENQRRRLLQVESDDVFRIWMNVVTHSFDPHTEYFPPRDAENFDIQMSLSLEGIGALLGSEGEYCRIERIVPAGPAEKDGRLQAADRIVAVGQGEDGELVDVVGWRNDEIVELIRGPAGSMVRLSILPAGQGDAATPRLVDLVRDKVKLEEQSAKAQVLELADDEGAWRVGLIDLPAFYIDFDAARAGDADYKSATRDVARLVDELADDGVDGIVLDLRGNGGGSLREAQELTGLFLGGGAVVQIRDADERIEVVGTPSGAPLWGGPLVVLVDRLSASASEIFSAAIQDTGRGVVVGSRTFGKGTVQALAPLGDGQLKITQAMFYRLSGGSTQHEGVTPDVTLPSLFDEDEIGESALESALPWDAIPPVKVKRARAVDKLKDGLQQFSEERRLSTPELAAMLAQLQFGQELALRTEVSLNEAQRRDDQLAMDGRQLEIENRLRAALGLEPIADLDELERDRDEVDPFAREAARVLVDFITERKARAEERAAQVR